MKLNRLTREQWIALSSLLVTYGLVACAPKTKTVEPLSPQEPTDGKKQTDNITQSEDDITRQKWEAFEAKLQNEFGSILEGGYLSETPTDPLSSETITEVDMIRAQLARDFVVRSRPLQLERAEFFADKLLKQIKETVAFEESSGLYHMMSPATSLNPYYDAIKTNFDVVMEEMRREHNGFLANLWEDTSEKVGEGYDYVVDKSSQGIRYVGDVTGASEAIEAIEEKGLSAVQPSLRDIPEGDEGRAYGEHGTKGGIGLVGGAAAYGLQKRLTTTGYRKIVEKANPENLIRALIDADPAVNEARVAWGKQKLVAEALAKQKGPFSLTELETELKFQEARLQKLHELTEKYRTTYGQNSRIHIEATQAWGRQTVAVKLAKDKLSAYNLAAERARLAFDEADALLKAYKAAESAAATRMNFGLKDGKFVAQESGFKTQEELIEALKKINYKEGRFGFVRSGLRIVLKVAAPVGAAFGMAELIPLALGEEIVWVPKDVAGTLSNSNN